MLMSQQYPRAWFTSCTSVIGRYIYFLFVCVTIKRTQLAMIQLCEMSTPYKQNLLVNTIGRTGSFKYTVRTIVNYIIVVGVGDSIHIFFI